MKRTTFVLMIIIGSQIFPGCKMNEPRHQMAESCDRNPDDETQLSIQRQQMNIYAVLEEIKLKERLEGITTREPFPAIPPEVHQAARAAKDSICSDQEFTNAMAIFMQKARLRSQAISAESRVYQAWESGARGY